MAESSYEELIEALKSTEEDVVKAYGGNRAAATRARKTLLVARETLNECRRELLACGKGPDKDGGAPPREVTAQLVTADCDQEDCDQ